jgi:hypothetical protein
VPLQGGFELPGSDSMDAKSIYEKHSDEMLAFRQILIGQTGCQRSLKSHARIAVYWAKGCHRRDFWLEKRY